ncbi:MAG: MBOAT family protein [Akkermansiaceae bacterium]
MIGLIASLTLVGVLAGPALRKVQRVSWRRLCGWAVLLLLVWCADSLMAESDPVLRMIGICCVLLGGMKGLVYAEWAGDRPLALGRYLLFAFCWFGMDPSAFQKRRTGLSWKADITVGLTLMLVGTLLGWLVWVSGWRQLLVMFLPMSLGFHFGALRVLKGVLRLSGFPVRTLFPNLLEARGVGDFWSRKWNVGYSQMMQRVVGRPITAVAGSNSGLMVVFLVSGLLHELAITLPVRSGFGLPTLFFVVHGLLVLAEKHWKIPMGRVPALLLVGLPLGLLFPEDFRDQIIVRCLSVFEYLPG